MRVSGKQDRAAGVMVGLACGDALGAAYEFGGPYPAEMPVAMKGGGPFGWEPGEWTDDTSMAIPLLQHIATGERPRDGFLSSAVDSWRQWMRETKDIGNQTAAVLGALRDAPENHSANDAEAAAAAFQRGRPDAAGNGSLMRTAPYGLLEDLDYAAHTALSQSALTHLHLDALIACALWSSAISHAVSTGELDIRIGLRLQFIEYSRETRSRSGASCALEDLPSADELVELWSNRIDEAECHPPEHFRNNGWVVGAFQAAWSSIVHTGSVADNDPGHFRRALETAVRSGGDTDTVAAIAGGLIGAAYGVSAVPLEWKRRIHGWPGWSANDLVEQALIGQSMFAVDDDARPIEEGTWPAIDHVDYSGWTYTDTCVPHPHDAGVLIGSVGALDQLPREIDAVVSLCRVGKRQVPERIDRQNRVAVWLVDSTHPSDNAHVDFVLVEAADLVARMRAEGRTVFLHCVQAQSRTPSVAALYSVRHLGIDAETALREVRDSLPSAHPNAAFTAAIRRLAKGDAPHGR